MNLQKLLYIILRFFSLYFHLEEKEVSVEKDKINEGIWRDSEST